MNTHIHENTNKHVSLEFGDVLARAWDRYKKVLLPLLALFGGTMLGVISAVLLIGAVVFGVISISSTSSVLTAVLAVVTVSLVFFVLYLLLAVAIMNIKIIRHPSFDFLRLFKESVNEVPRVFTASFVSQLAIFGGIVLGILPGLWLSIILMFVFTIAVLEKLNTAQAISKSAHLVKGNFWNVFAFMLFMGIVSLVFNLIPSIGFLLGIFFSFFASVLTYELYTTLEHNKKMVEGHVYKEKNILLVTKLFAFFAVVAILALTLFAISLISAGIINA